jgi:hypothetical protein
MDCFDLANMALPLVLILSLELFDQLHQTLSEIVKTSHKITSIV